MRYLKKYNESQDDDIDNIQDVIQSWIDGLDFEIVKVDNYTNKNGIYYRLYRHKNQINLILYINDSVNWNKEILELKDSMDKLTDHLKSIGYKIFYIYDTNLGYTRIISICLV